MRVVGREEKTAGSSEGKNKALSIAISQIEKNFGKGSIMKMGEHKNLEIEVIPTGSLALDAALGVGGLPRGRVIEIFGPEGGGKTTVSLHAIAQVQKKGGIAAFIDAEHALDPLYAKRIGVDVNNLLISQPDYGEQALEIAETLIRSGAIDIIVVDSVAALVPKREIEGEMGDAQVGLQARLMSQALRKLTAVISKSKTVMVFINQLREKIGIMFGNPETTPGGRALKFYSSVRLDVRAAEKIKEGDKIIGTRVKVKVVKNKVAPPFREATFVNIHGEGLLREADILDQAVNFEIAQKGGAWYTFGSEKLGQGFEASIKFLKENPKLTNKMEAEVRKAIMAIVAD
ncbi:MAG: recombinase RecA [Candidatus Margulisbacteria bacterium]|nr:recombinase RecA [Candidatus Margulisiibacteriota bacterium]